MFEDLMDRILAMSPQVRMVGYTKGLGYPTIQKAREGLESLDPRDDRAFHHLIAPTITGSLTRLSSVISALPSRASAGWTYTSRSMKTIS